MFITTIYMKVSIEIFNINMNFTKCSTFLDYETFKFHSYYLSQTHQNMQTNIRVL